MRTLAAVLLAFCLYTHAQTSVIDTAKLPADPEVRDAFRDLVEVEPMTGAYRPDWPYKVPKAKVEERLSRIIGVLKAAQAKSPHNAELNMLLGIAAACGYNIDLPGTHELNISSLTAAMADAPTDFRPETFLGEHFCSTLKNVEGMQHLLHVEQTFTTLPNWFWRDQALCGMMTNMPGRVIYAVDRAQLQGEDKVFAEEAHKRIKPTSVTEKYPAKDVWQASGNASGVRFTSHLCGVSFFAAPTLQNDAQAVEKGKCVITLSTENYPGKVTTHSSATYMVLSLPTEGKSPDELKRSFLKGDKALPTTAYKCPVRICEAFDIIKPGMYPEQGGAHIIVVFFTSSQPKYPGLRIEQPSQLSMPDPSQSGAITLRSGEVLGRLPGDLFYAVIMDSSVNIFDRARPGFEQLLNTMAIDTD